MKWDVRYLEHFGFAMDAKILIFTFLRVIGHDGVVEGYNFEKESKSA